MCGIAGWVHDDPARPIDRAALERMGRALRARGPDASGLWQGPGVGLAHRRLSIIDLSDAGRQPIANEDGSVQVVFNGEIYNFVELREELQKRGHRLRSRTDSEVLAHLYEEHGDGLLERIDGMFALGIWDVARRRLLLARDRVGKKPLKYARIDGGLAFASELKALLAARVATPRASGAAIQAFLSFGYVPAPETGLVGVQKLPAGHKLVYEDGRVAIERYWSLDFARKERLPEADWRARVRSEVERAVERRLVADVPLGAFLSGGIDSSIVVACMARASSRPVETFSIGFEHERYDERPHARAIAERYGTSHHEFCVRADDVDLLPELARVYEEPYADPSALATYLLSRETRRSVTVALCGDGGDEGFAGYERYIRAARWERPGAWLRRSGAHAVLRALRRGLRPGGGRLDRIVDGLVQLGNPALGPRYAWLVRLLSDRERAALASASGAGATETWATVESPLDRVTRWVDAPQAGRAAFDRLCFADLSGYLPDDLMVKVDLASMAHGLEVRAPLLDHRVLELAASAPIDVRCPGGQLKGLLKQAFLDVFPPGLLERPKQGFGLPLQEWFRGPLLPLARELLLAADARCHAYLDRSALGALIDDHLSQRASRGFQLWALVMLELWHRELGATLA